MTNKQKQVDFAHAEKKDLLCLVLPKKLSRLDFDLNTRGWHVGAIIDRKEYFGNGADMIDAYEDLIEHFQGKAR